MSGATKSARRADRWTTEIHASRLAASHTPALIRELRRRSMIVALFNPDAQANIEIIKRAYSMNSIWVPDFNGDGEVNTIDLTEFNLALSEPYSRATYLFGNVFQDPQGARDQQDVEYFIAAYNAEFGKTFLQRNLQYVVQYFGPDDL